MPAALHTEAHHDPRAGPPVHRRRGARRLLHHGRGPVPDGSRDLRRLAPLVAGRRARHSPPGRWREREHRHGRARAAIVLVLPSNPTTGYSWTVTSLPDPGHVSLDSPIEGVYVATPVASGVVGSGGTQSWDLHATKAGTTSIALAYVRPWESGVPPVEAFAVTFAVQ